MSENVIGSINRVWTLTVLSHFLEQHKDIEIV